ncbi:MAG: DUF3488 and DUF4129 domain-containing transglutaminase family protein [Granulosicoccus sp.]
MSATQAMWHKFIPELGQTRQPDMDARTLYALASLLLLVQLPHVLHLPLWVSVTGSTLVGLRLLLLKKSDQWALRILLSPVSVTLIAAASAMLIKADFGYFIGRDPSVAFLSVLVAAKFAEVRRTSDATLLLCLAAFLLLTQYFYSQTILSALITLPAVIALAYSLAVLRDPGNPSQVVEQLKLVGTLLIQGLPLAALLFVVFPRLPGPLWSLPEDAMASTGLSDSMSPGSIGQLSQSAQVAFRVEFEGTPPPNNQRYWRGPVLSEFDGRSWGVSSVNHLATPQYSGAAQNLLNYTVTLQPHRQKWLFALDAAASLPTSSTSIEQNGGQANPAETVGRLMSDGQMIARKPVSQVLRYRQSSLLTDAVTPAHKPTAQTLSLPGKNIKTIAFANELRKNSDSHMDYANRVLQHFNQQQFYYTLSPQLLGDTPVDEFLFGTRSGFCEHYAAAFVVLMRGAGIPARVVTGYLGGEINGDYMIVRQSDAHAWAEAFINGAWRRFDPTGAVAPSRVEQGLAAALPNESQVPRLAREASGWLRDAQLRWDAMNHDWQRMVIDFDNKSQDELWDKLGLPKPALWQITLAVLLFAGTWCAAVLGMPSFKRSKLAADERLWLRLCQLLTSYGLMRGQSETSTEFLHRCAMRWPEQSERFIRMNTGFNALRFTPLVDSERNELRQSIKRDYRVLIWSLFKTEKLRKSASKSLKHAGNH